MTSDEIRRTFIEFFQQQDHLRLPSSSLIPAEFDPSVLFTIAGMVPLKPYFQGVETPPHPRATTCQKTFRTSDIEIIGTTTGHLTFFEMLGNFSFGDYFKPGAVDFAWRLSRDGFGFPEQDIWITVFAGDDELGLGPDEEAIQAWLEVGVPRERIVECPRSENFWQMGPTGPCGPCSELYLDRGAEHGKPDDLPGGENERFLEYWNLVFMQFDQNPQGVLTPLPAKNIDTGLGLNRLASILQDKPTVFETDQFAPLIALGEELSGRRYGDDYPTDKAFRVLADHGRSIAFLLADGVVPSNEDRGYVLRRIMRRAILHGRGLGLDADFLRPYADRVTELMGSEYPELHQHRDLIRRWLTSEEESFGRALEQGLKRLDELIARARDAGAEGIAGADAFLLHDTYGFPIDLTLEMAAEQGVAVDEAGFRRLMAEQRARAKADATAKKVGHGDVSAYRAALELGGSDFTGYREIVRESLVTALVGEDGLLPAASEGDEVLVVLDATPFYAEGGGQQSDWGRITINAPDHSAQLSVLDVQSPLPGLIAHRVLVHSGEVRPGDIALAEVDVTRRHSVSRSHSATHLLHRALRRNLGETASQAGSLNAPGRLRFDFKTPSAVPASVLGEVEDEINEQLLRDLEVRWFVTDQDEARRLGAIAMFGEKYGDKVRVVEMGDYSIELCGGTHVERSAQIGMVKLLNEASIGSGVRRVEALVGLDAFRYLAREHVLVSQLATEFKAQPEELPERINGVLERLKTAEKELERLHAANVLADAAAIAGSATWVGPIALVRAQVAAGVGPNDLRALALDVRGRLPGDQPAVVVLASPVDGAGASFVIAVNSAGQRAGYSAGELARVFAPVLGARGGGKADLAQGAGGDAALLEVAFDALEASLGSG
jgi:alanyl-tRNA synthetase